MINITYLLEYEHDKGEKGNCNPTRINREIKVRNTMTTRIKYNQLEKQSILAKKWRGGAEVRTERTKTKAKERQSRVYR